nr:hypothetical protein [Micromonospora sp. DSM 115978]
EVVERLAHPSLTWEVGEVRKVVEAPITLPDGRVLGPPRYLEVLVTSGSAAVLARLSRAMPVAEAVAQFAAGLQDHAFYETWGACLPPCPGHSHPLDAQVVDGTPMWICPADPLHRAEPIASLRWWRQGSGGRGLP